MLQTKNLTTGYFLRHHENRKVMEGLSLTLREGALTCLIGLNGTGKSTLLRTLCGFQLPLEGSVTIDGKSLESFSRNALSKIIAVVLTERTTGSGLTVRETVSLGRYPYTGYFGSLTEIDRSIVEDSIAAVGMQALAERYTSDLSDGERQKTMIAKALAQQCQTIILDEPTAFLDITSKTEVISLLRTLAREQKKSILLSTHDTDLARRFADEWWIAWNGTVICGEPEKIISAGTAAEIFNRNGIEVF